MWVWSSSSSSITSDRICFCSVCHIVGWLKFGRLKHNCPVSATFCCRLVGASRALLDYFMADSTSGRRGAWATSSEEEVVAAPAGEGVPASGWSTDDEEQEVAIVRPPIRGRGASRGRGRGRAGRPPGMRALKRQALRERQQEEVTETAIVVRKSWASHVRVVGSGASHDMGVLLKADLEVPIELAAVPRELFGRCTDPYVPRRLTTFQAEAEILGVANQSYVRDLVLEFGAAVYFVSRLFFASFASWLCYEIDNNGLKADCLFDMLSQDETSMKTGERDKPFGSYNRRARGKTKGWTTVPKVNPEDEDASFTYGSVIIKILQTEYLILFLVSRGDRYILYFAELPTPLQRTMKGNHRQLFAAISCSIEFELLQGLRHRFAHHISMSNADRGAPGLKTDRLFQALFPTVPRLSGLGCFCHFTNSAQKSQMDVLEETVSGVVAFSLAVKEDGKWKEFRKNAADTLFQNAKVYYDTPPPGPSSVCRLRTDKLLFITVEIGLHVGERLRWKRLHDRLVGVLAGDELSIYIPGPVLPPDAEKLYVRRFTNGLSRDLVPKLFTTFQRQRWVLNLQRMRQLALMGSVHGLLKRTVDKTFPSRKRAVASGAWASSSDEASKPKQASDTAKAEQKGSAAYWAQKTKLPGAM